MRLLDLTLCFFSYMLAGFTQCEVFQGMQVWDKALQAEHELDETMSHIAAQHDKAIAQGELYAHLVDIARALEHSKTFESIGEALSHISR